MAGNEGEKARGDSETARQTQRDDRVMMGAGGTFNHSGEELELIIRFLLLRLLLQSLMGGGGGVRGPV